MLLKFVSVVSTIVLLAMAQNCGPSYDNQVCAAGNCCSQYGWCDTDAAHCDAATCLSKYSGAGSSCASLGPSTLVSSVTTKKTNTGKSSTKTSTGKSSAKTSTGKSSTKTSTASSTAPAYASQVPNIDVCGAASNGISCPGAGLNGYFYRCCSTAGHCGPKNDIQDQNLYCGTGCQAGYGKCDSEKAPPKPTGTPGVAQAGDTCGPIVNRKCMSGLCCSGSNYCGNGTDFCGAANWCQSSYGRCD